MARGRSKETLALVQAAYDVLQEEHPMTLRQCYYQLVASLTIPNNKASYDRLGRHLVNARLLGEIPMEWIEDRTRIPHVVPMWDDTEDFLYCVLPQFALDVWNTQPQYVELWTEKDALTGLLWPIVRSYSMTLQVCRGYQSMSALEEAAKRFNRQDDNLILYFGDFDPSGWDMPRVIGEYMQKKSCNVPIKRCALNLEDIETYRLPQDFAKKTDTRAKAFIKQFGDIAVELDSLPANVLRERVTHEIEASLDLEALEEARSQEEEERTRLMRFMAVNE